MQKKLTRVREGKLLGGICTGFGKYFDVDPVVVRVAFIVLSFFGGGGLLIYLILWLIIPEEKSSLPPYNPCDSGNPGS